MNDLFPIYVRPDEYDRVLSYITSLRAGGSPGAVIEADEPAAPDEAVVTAMYADSKAPHKAVLKYLASRPNEWVSSDELARAAGLQGSRSLGGLLGPFQRKAKNHHGGATLWEKHWSRADNEVTYRMPAEVAGWVREAAASER